MPVVHVNLWEEILNETTEPKLIELMTNAICETLGERARPFTTVIIHGVPQRRWATGGVIVESLEDTPRLVEEISAMLPQSS